MFHLIRARSIGQEATEPLEGTAEVDETLVGRKPRAYDRWLREQKMADKRLLFGMVERGGQVRAEIIPCSGAGDIRPRITENVKAGATLYTDGWHGYRTMPQYAHAWLIAR